MQSSVLEPAYREHWEKAINETVDLFAGFIKQHNEQEGHKADVGDTKLNFHISQAFKEIANNQISSVQIEVFKGALRNYLYQEAEEIDNSEYDEEIVISIDYSPDEKLIKCLREAKIFDAVLPLKSVIRVNPAFINYKIGYSSEWKRITIEW